MPHNTIPDIFDVQVYGEVQPINQTLSKARCRIFYKYENRNGGYITDEFAEKLISTVPYAPIKGIFDGEAGDFRDHGWERTEGRIYGVVMAEPNFAWESHVDNDGATRVYACVDVLLFTGLYPQAKMIVGKPQSMELYSPSIKGEWKDMGGPYEYFVYEDACFLGLQVLGDDVEPCFEGASFFSLVESIQELVGEIKRFTAAQQIEGGKDMEENVVIEETEAEVAEEVIEEVAAEEEVAEEVIEEVTEEAEAPETHDLEEAEVEAEEAAEPVEEAVEEVETEAEEVVEDTENEDIEIENVEEDVENATLNTESEIAADNARLAEELEKATAKVAELEAEVAELREFKLASEKAEKENVIASYEEMLSEEVLTSYTARIDEFSARDLDKELAYEVKQSNSGMFAKMPESNPGIIPSGEPEVSGLEGLLSKYRK